MFNLTFGPVDCEGPALVIGDVEGDGVAALAAAEVGQVARVHAVVGVQVGVCNRMIFCRLCLWIMVKYVRYNALGCRFPVSSS